MSNRSRYGQTVYLQNLREAARFRCTGVDWRSSPAVTGMTRTGFNGFCSRRLKSSPLEKSILRSLLPHRFVASCQPRPGRSTSPT